MIGSAPPPSLRALSAGLSVASKRLVLVGAALLLAMVAAVGLTLWYLRAAALDDARLNIGKLGIAIAEQTSRSIQAVDLMLLDSQKSIVDDGIDTPAAFSQTLGSALLQAALRQQQETLPQAEAFTIVGADGKLVNFSRAWPIPKFDFSDRDYYKYFRVHDDPGVFVSQPTHNRTNGRWTVYVVRRVNGKSGNFIGLVVGAIKLDYFEDFYRAVTVGSDTSVMLIRRDGTALATFPAISRIGEVIPASSPWHRIVATRHAGDFIARGAFTGKLRIISVHPLPDYPMVVDISVTKQSVLAHWRFAAQLAALGTGSAVLCVILLLRALMLQLRRLERSESSLADQNLSLIAARRRMESQADALRESQHALAKTSGALKTTLDHMSQGIMMVDADRRVAVWNAKAIELLELPAELTTPGIPYRDVVAYQHGRGEFNSNGASLDAALLEPSIDGPLVYERTRPNGRVLEVQSVRLETGGMVRTYTDITDRRASEAQIRYFAHHDDLTKLVNRVVFLARLAHAIELADRTGRSIAVLYLDLDRFKVINDSEGHAIGDKLLRQVAARLRDASRDIDTVARMGGDEFAIIQPLIDQPDASAKFAARIMQVVAQPYDIDGLQCRVGISIGIAHYPEDAMTVAELLRHADTALYRAKTDGRGLYRVFEPQMDARQQELFALEQELRQALDARQFEVEYQPIVETTSGRIASCEALLRWRHPGRGTVPPADFIGIAERSGLIMPIGLWVLETACREAATWPNGVRVSVNLSPVQFNQDSLVDEMTNILERTGLSPDRLSLEVTEGLLLEATDAVLSIMERLRGLGIRFSLDDFGTGYAGLGYLRRFPFDAIKIDKFFVNDMVEQPEMRAIVEALLGIGAALKLEVVAEGVETQAQLTDLRRLGCTYVQGFLTGRPQLAVEIRAKIIAGS